MARAPRKARSVVVSVVDAAPKAAKLVKSAARALEILEYFDDVKCEARVGEITNRLGYPQSSTTYLLKSLTAMGYLDFRPSTRTYMPTPRVALLGAWISGVAISDGMLIRLMNDIGEATGQTVTLGARNGIYAQYIHVIERNNGFPMHVPTGTCRLLVWSAAGFALLRDESDKNIRALVTRTNAEVSNLPGTIRSRDVLAHVESFRSRGHFVSNELVTPGGAHISMSLPPAITEGRTLVVGISGRSDVITRHARRFVADMEATIERIHRLALRRTARRAGRSPGRER